MRSAFNHGLALFLALGLIVACTHTTAPLMVSTTTNITLLEVNQPINVYGGADIITCSVDGRNITELNPSNDRVAATKRSLTDSGCTVGINCGIYIQLRIAPSISRQQLNVTLALLLELYSQLDVPIYLRLQEDASLRQVPLVAEITTGQVTLP